MEGLRAVIVFGVVYWLLSGAQAGFTYVMMQRRLRPPESFATPLYVRWRNFGLDISFLLICTVCGLWAQRSVDRWMRMLVEQREHGARRTWSALIERLDGTTAANRRAIASVFGLEYRAGTRSIVRTVMEGGPDSVRLCHSALDLLEASADALEALREVAAADAPRATGTWRDSRHGEP